MTAGTPRRISVCAMPPNGSTGDTVAPTQLFRNTSRSVLRWLRSSTPSRRPVSGSGARSGVSLSSSSRPSPPLKSPWPMKCSTCGRMFSSASSSRSRVVCSSVVMLINPRLVSGMSASSSLASSSPICSGATPPGEANAISTRSGGEIFSVGVGSSTSSQRTTGFIRSENRKSSFSGLYRNSQGRRPSSGVSVVSMTKRRPLPCCGSMPRRLSSMPVRSPGQNRA